MEENQSDLPQDDSEFHTPAETPVFSTLRRDDPKVRLVMLVLFGAILGGMLLGPMLFQLLSSMLGWDSSAITGGTFSADAGPDERAQMRWFLGLSHFSTFVLPGFFTIWFLYKGPAVNGLPHWTDYLGVRRWPNARTLGLSILLLLVSLPLVMFLYNVNKALPLPDLLRQLESDTMEALKGLLRMDTPGELFANLLIIALLPAIGEELLFRGILQQQLMRRMANPLLAILAAALIFSFIHLQFEGFLSRVLLGMLLGWVYWRSGNFWVPVSAHFVNNGMQVIGQYLYHKELSTVDLEQDIEMPWIAAVISVALVWWVVRGLRGSAT